MLEILFQTDLIGGSPDSAEKLNGLRPFLSKRFSIQQDWVKYLAKMFKSNPDKVSEVYQNVYNILKKLENKQYKAQKAKEVNSIIFMCKDNGDSSFKCV
jgi:hypothetical protein